MTTSLGRLTKSNIGRLTYGVKWLTVKLVGDTKADIISAARTVLIREGSAGFSVRKVAKETGISLGNLQYHFASKTDLLGGLLAADVAEYRRVYAELRGEVDRTSEDRERRGLLRRFIALALGDARVQEELAVFRALLSFPETEIAALLESYYRELSELLIEGLAELSTLPPDSAAVARAATLLFPYLDGYAATAPFLPMDTEQSAELLTETVWLHLRPPDKRTAPDREAGGGRYR